MRAVRQNRLRRPASMLGAALLAMLVGSPVLAATGAASPDRHRRTGLDPGRFAELAGGVVRVRTFNCGGTATADGTGFLIGSRVVMTARHVIHGGCGWKVQTSNGAWIRVDKATSWARPARNDTAAADVSTLRLDTPVNGYVFTIRTWSAAVGTHVAMLGYPLDERELSLTQGRVAVKIHVQGEPMLGLQLLGAEGASGSPIVDPNGRVVSILQIGLGSKDALGQRTSGAILGIDLPSWWPTAKRDLCRAYPAGGLPTCPGSKPAPAGSPQPKPTPRPRPPAPAPPPASPPAPVTPAPAAWTPPAGFSLWTGDGTYEPGTIAWQTAPCTRTYSSATACWGVNIVSETGCRDDAFVRVELYDSGGGLVDTGIDRIGALGVDEIGSAHGDTFLPAASFEVTSIDCFDY